MRASGAFGVLQALSRPLHSSRVALFSTPHQPFPRSIIPSSACCSPSTRFRSLTLVRWKRHRVEDSRQPWPWSNPHLQHISPVARLRWHSECISSSSHPSTIATCSCNPCVHSPSFWTPSSALKENRRNRKSDEALVYNAPALPFSPVFAVPLFHILRRPFLSLSTSLSPSSYINKPPHYQMRE